MKISIFQQSQTFLVIGDIDAAAVKAELKIAPGDDCVLAGEEIKIENLRELLRWLHLKPMSGGAKLAIITNADKIKPESANTLLKTLEEPPEYAKIILTTLDEQKILPTIQSRCQKIRTLVDPAKKMSEAYLSPDELNQMPIKDKFTWVAKIAELPISEIIDILTAWQIYFREKLLKNSDQTIILNQIWRAKELTTTNISVKLLLENVVLNF